LTASSNGVFDGTVTRMLPVISLLWPQQPKLAIIGFGPSPQHTPANL
jgi:hypothetical protein